MIGILADQHMGEQPRAGSATLDRPRWQRRPGEAVAAGAARRGRTIRFTTNRPGTYSSSSVTSAPIRRSVPPQSAQLSALGVSSIPLRGMCSGKHYVDIWTDPRMDIRLQAWSTFVYATARTFLQLLFSSMAAYVLARYRFPYRNTIFYLILATVMIPHEVMLVPLHIMVKSGPFAGGNDWLGAGGTSWLDTKAGLILPGIISDYSIFFLRQFFMTLTKELEEAARIDGCSEFGIWRRVALPMSIPALTTLGIFSFQYAWSDYTLAARHLVEPGIAHAAARPRDLLLPRRHRLGDADDRGVISTPAADRAFPSSAALHRHRHQLRSGQVAMQIVDPHQHFWDLERQLPALALRPGRRSRSATATIRRSGGTTCRPTTAATPAASR